MTVPLRDKLSQFLPFLKRKTKRNAQEALSLKPIRLPGAQWERSEKTGFVVVSYRRDYKGSFDRFLGRVFQIDTSRKIEMTDELSSLVWEMCDGENSVGAIAAKISDDYKLTRRQAQVSVLAFLNTLEKKSLIGALVPRNSRAANAMGAEKSGHRAVQPDRAKRNKGVIHARRKQ
jgi:hypothetical protein